MRIKLATPLILLNLVLNAQPGWAADYAAGFAAYSAGDYETALAEWQPLAEQGDANSQFGLGLLYGQGFGVPMDDEQALKWYGLAADQGHAEAQYKLGLMYQNGWGVEQSDATAFKWMQASAEGGFADAQRALGEMYADGIGVAMDLVQAYRWFETGASLGDSESGFNRDELESSMQPADIDAAKDLARTWLDQFHAEHPEAAMSDAQQ
jgi:uncharacterized protein